MPAHSSDKPHPIPLLYRIVFRYVDPLFCILGFYGHVFDPIQTSIGYGVQPSAADPVAIGTQHMLDNLAAFFVLLFVLEAVLLRVRSRDATVWQLVEAGGFLLDVVMTLGAVRQLRAEGRLGDFSTYTGDDWHHVFGNAGFGVLRLACAVGIGIGDEHEPAAKKGKKA